MSTRIIFFALLLALPAIAGEPVILLTGFGQVKDKTKNYSWEAIRDFQGKTIAGHRVETIGLPYVYDAVEAPLKEAIAKFKPAAVVCFGDSARSLRIERAAQNTYRETKPLDNNGQPPPRDKIVPGGKDSIPSGLPIEAIYEELRSDFLVPILSEVSEGSVGNEAFYRLMLMDNAPAVRGMVLLPEPGAQDPYAREIYTVEGLRRLVQCIAAMSVGKSPVRVLAAGDGFVNALGVRKDRWVTMLTDRFIEDGVTARESVVYASEGYRIADVEKELKRAGGQRFDYVFIQVGASDHIAGLASRNFSIAEILKLASKFKNAKIIVLSIPDFTASTFGKAQGYNSELSRKKLKQFNEILSREADEAGALYVDITPQSVQFGEDRKMQSYEIYYAPKMYELWAEHIYSTLKAKKLLPK